ncbi:hypothetical protein CPAR01_06506 [Colletotrichum paranaense]|uniref:ToxB-like N-terminal ascomycota domain-containing protein n=1 Tax=Colletotrichum paranaense TaxID=1914294 RepID=A0ABQ9SN78_9PEZI|nr:uncharacterized protein CPAR01_06506 [Colletotrichum paranaense]KAK1540517.1 hypothetical protein CPAR01_06506 [Colletotrichum paranaense]
MKITAAICLVTGYISLAAAAGCQVELLNINQAVVGTGCVQMNYYANIYDSTRRAGYTVNANSNCGLSFGNIQVIPEGRGASIDVEVSYEEECILLGYKDKDATQVLHR